MICPARLVLLAIACASPLASAKADDLYDAEAIVTGTEEPERTRGLKSGLVDVVVKLTGDARLAADPRLEGLLHDAHSFVEAFQYEDRMKNLPVRDEQGTRERPHFLRMHFDQAKLDRALAARGISKWTERPVLCIWISVKAEAASYVVARDGQAGYAQRESVVGTAKRLGIPIWLPGSTTLKNDVAFDHVAAANLGKLATVTPPGSPILVGSLEATAAGYWNINWNLRWQGQARAWTQQEVTFDVAFREGLQNVALVLSAKSPL